MLKRRRRPGHTPSVIVAIAVVAVVAVAFLATGREATPTFGKFAGYRWHGPVTSVQATWTVPRIVGGSPTGKASTWIGAQAGGRAEPFIQIGTNELRLGGPSVAGDYHAFWSDTTHHFLGQRLFGVGAGDVVTASMTLAHHRWQLAIRDETTGRAARFSTADEGSGTFVDAEWLQEHVGPHGSRDTWAYPELTTVGFRRLAVNARAPRYADLYSVWMSETGHNLAPTPLRNDAFSLRHVSISSAGARYLRLAARAKAANREIAAKLAGIGKATPQTEVLAARSLYVRAVADAVRELVAAQWPARIRPLVGSLVDRDRTLLAHARSAAFVAEIERRVPVPASIHAAGLAQRRAAQMLRRALALPEVDVEP